MKYDNVLRKIKYMNLSKAGDSGIPGTGTVLFLG